MKIRSTRLSTNVEEWTVIYCDTAEEVEECITDPMLIWPILQKTVKRILEEGRDSLPAAEIRCLEMVGSVWVTCRRADIDTTLSKLLAWRERREEYEECAEIRDLLSEMYRKDEEAREEAQNAASSAKPSSSRRRRKL